MVDPIRHGQNVSHTTQKASVKPTKQLLALKDITAEIAETVLPVATTRTKAALGKSFDREAKVLHKGGKPGKLFKAIIK